MGLYSWFARSESRWRLVEWIAIVGQRLYEARLRAIFGDDSLK
jgi:hypothetical protein